MNNNSFFPTRSSRSPSIYAYEELADNYRGFLKVGYTTRDALTRVLEQHSIKQPDGHLPFKIVVDEPAMYDDGNTFTDKQVHAALKAMGIQNVGGEWFKCTKDDVLAAIVAVRQHKVNLQKRTADFHLRKEQEEAIDMIMAYFLKEKDNPAGQAPKFLWNAKMRFGKTFTAYELAKRMGMKRVLILTFKPAVEASWEEDLDSHIDFEGWQFYSKNMEDEKGTKPEDLDQSRPIVCFGSFQDFLGENEFGGIKVKNKWVHLTEWDMVIFDEYHYGAWREKAKDLFKIPDDDAFDSETDEKYKEEEADNALNETFIPIKSKYYLYLSGTPFRALNSGEFVEDQIFNWTYSDEQRAKENWAAEGPNPYASLPRIVLMTYKMPDEIRNVALNTDYNEFDLNQFFYAETNTGNIEDSEFKLKEYVQKWLDLIRGAYLPTNVDDLRFGSKPYLPYAYHNLLTVLNHTLWFLPNVASCYAMRNLLRERQNVFYHDYKVIVCAGTQAGIGLDALGPVREAMRNPLESKTITLSCGKLTTGVTIKPWTGIFMLRNLSSPETYFQAAFRVQSPWTMKDENGKEIVLKEECYIFDFAPNRSLKQISDYACDLNIQESNPEKKVVDFINFLPVLAYDGSTMQRISASEVLDIAMSGTSASLLARTWESSLLVNVDNGTLDRLLRNKEAMDALMKIEGFRNLNKDIETIITKSELVRSIRKNPEENKDGYTKKELSDTEKEYKSKRKMIQEKLIKFATRIPVFMYLTDFREYSLKDVITKIEPNLFKKVTGLTVDDFELLVSLGVFNDSRMNDAVYKFKRFEDESLEYTGVNKHSADENVGLFSTTITREDYEALAKSQQQSMEVPSFTPGRLMKVKIEQYAKTEPSKNTVSYEGTTTNAHQNSESSSQNYSNIRVGSAVVHGRFGEGVVSSLDLQAGRIQVVFKDGTKVFQFPKAFERGFLKEIDK
ncbi:MAG TPA: DEAD/DEAH box helicase family protein [Candidatus Enterosoma merdigallinarum]|nr:DEAD/DEAH box helicase family protein [Candidatus Enterosoma merdigallinarum]